MSENQREKKNAEVNQVENKDKNKLNSIDKVDWSKYKASKIPSFQALKRKKMGIQQVPFTPEQLKNATKISDSGSDRDETEGEGGHSVQESDDENDLKASKKKRSKNQKQQKKRNKDKSRVSPSKEVSRMSKVEKDQTIKSTICQLSEKVGMNKKYLLLRATKLLLTEKDYDERFE